MKKILLFFAFSFFAVAVYSQTIPKMKINDVLNSFNKNNDTVYVINFWATFCKPCNEEIPYFISLAKKYENKKVKLILVSLDLPDYYPAKITAFVKKHNYNSNIAWLDETNADIFCPAIDKKWSGAIPATLIINNKTGYRRFVEDEMKPEIFESILKLAIAKSNSGVTLKYHSFDPINEPE